MKYDHKKSRLNFIFEKNKVIELNFKQLKKFFDIAEIAYKPSKIYSDTLIIHKNDFENYILKR
jgi:hypothetical protein